MNLVADTGPYRAGLQAAVDAVRRFQETVKMPKGTKVDSCYQKLKGKMGKASAARVCQKSTGQALATGKKPKSKGK